MYDKLRVMTVRADEAKWGPLRSRAMATYIPFLRLIKRLLLATTVMETRLALMDNLVRKDKNHDACAIFRAFHSSPTFRSSLRAYTHKLSTTLTSLTELFSVDFEYTEQRGCVDIPPVLEKTRVSIQELRALYAAFDQAYYDTRVQVYYRMKLPINSPAFMNMNGFLYYNGWTTSFIEDFVNDCEKCYSAGEVTCINYLLALLRDMLPDQRPYFAFWNKEGKLDVSVKLRRRLLSSFTLALSMPIGGYYGLAAGRQQPFLAAFTIAYLSGGGVTGMNLVTSINRALGTVLACIYTLMIILCVDGIEARDEADTVDATIFISFAVVLFQIPCIFLRAQPILSYTGTVAGFSSILLLLSGKALERSVATDRIIDTFVGIIIYLSLELSMSPTNSELVLLEDLAATTAAIDERFSHFLKRFEGESSYCDNDDDGVTSKPKSAARFLQDGQGHGELDFSAKRILLIYNDAELPTIPNRQAS